MTVNYPIWYILPKNTKIFLLFRQNFELTKIFLFIIIVKS